MVLENMNCCEKKQLFLKINDEFEQIPFTFIKGKKQGLTALITAGVHACEYTAIETARRLSNEIDANDVTGNIIISNLLNVEAFRKRTPFIVPQDNKNLNKVMPGDKNGTKSEQIAYFLCENFAKISDFALDLHSGDLQEELTPHLYYIKSQEKRCIDFANKTDIPYAVPVESSKALYGYMAILNKPALLMERGQMGNVDRDEVDKFVNDVKNILCSQGIYDYKNCSKEDKMTQIIKKSIYKTADMDGFFISHKKVGEIVKKDEELYRIEDVFSNVKSIYKAEFDGIILYKCGALAIEKEHTAIAYGSI